MTDAKLLCLILLQSLLLSLNYDYY